MWTEYSILDNSAPQIPYLETTAWSCEGIFLRLWHLETGAPGNTLKLAWTPSPAFCETRHLWNLESPGFSFLILNTVILLLWEECQCLTKHLWFLWLGFLGLISKAQMTLKAIPVWTYYLILHVIRLAVCFWVLLMFKH